MLAASIAVVRRGRAEVGTGSLRGLAVLTDNNEARTIEESFVRSSSSALSGALLRERITKLGPASLTVSVSEPPRILPSALEGIFAYRSIVIVSSLSL